MYLSFSGVVLELWAGGVGSAGSGAPEEICMSCTASAALATGSPACCTDLLACRCCHEGRQAIDAHQRQALRWNGFPEGVERLERS